MISDDPDEDADLDDDAAIGSFLGETTSPKDDAALFPDITDWPPHATLDPELTVDAETLAWFKATHAHWRRQISAVLRAWMIANSPGRNTPKLADQ